MELTELQPIQLQYMDQWFSNVVDTINYDLQQIEGAVIALSMMLTNLDPAPTQDLQASLDKLINDLNESFEKIEDQFSSLDSRLKAIGG